jgi:hypothetical protein
MTYFYGRQQRASDVNYEAVNRTLSSFIVLQNVWRWLSLRMRVKSYAEAEICQLPPEIVSHLLPGKASLA